MQVKEFITVTDPDGNRVTLTALAASRNLNYCTLHCRWKQYGRPERITEKMLEPANTKDKSPYIIDGKEYRSAEYAAEALNLDHKRIQRRCKELGRRNITMEEILSGPPRKRKSCAVFVFVEGYGRVTFRKIADEIWPDLNRSQHSFRSIWRKAGRPETVTKEMFPPRQEKTTQVADQHEEPKVATDSRYKDPNFLPHIKFGDLAHLSGKENTGAARDEDAEFYWRTSNMFGKSFKTVVVRLA